MLSGRRGFLGKIAGVLGLTNLADLEDSAGSAGRDLLKPPPETMFPSKKYMEVAEEAEKTAKDIRKIRDENLNESTVFLGNVNSYEFSVPHKRSFELSEAEEIIGSNITEDTTDSEYRKLLEETFTDRKNRQIEREYMNFNPMTDSIEPRLLIDKKLDIDVIELGETDANPEEVAGTIENSLDPVLGPEYDLNVQALKETYEDTNEAFEKIQETYSENDPATLQVYLTSKQLGPVGLRGYAPMDGNTAVNKAKINKLYGYDKEDIMHTPVHEVGHSVGDIEHTADEDDLMFYGGGTNSTEFGERSTLLLKRYLNSSLETEIERDRADPRLLIGFQPDMIEPEKAETEFLSHLETYMRDVMEFEDFENWELEYEGETDLNYDRVQATRDFETGERIEMDMEIDYFVEDISTQASM